ncbi:hypothetical protein D3C87_1099040 [compost metagenome]
MDDRRQVLEVAAGADVAALHRRLRGGGSGREQRQARFVIHAEDVRRQVDAGIADADQQRHLRAGELADHQHALGEAVVVLQEGLVEEVRVGLAAVGVVAVERAVGARAQLPRLARGHTVAARCVTGAIGIERLHGLRRGGQEVAGREQLPAGRHEVIAEYVVGAGHLGEVGLGLGEGQHRVHREGGPGNRTDADDAGVLDRRPGNAAAGHAVADEDDRRVGRVDQRLRHAV